ncbi:GNAT family N-acetyltransferase [Christensenellaceae bacterium OttesenSCG-928-L17]|nr:GNAT family N-acetyltransferase [Christensenellaceae bacterium OttesenSCG-928-L17]
MLKKYTKNEPIPAACWEQVYALLSQSLPANERRSREVQRALLAREDYALYVYVDAGEVAAFVAAYEYETIRFGEHFAVSPSLRGQGLGGTLLQAYLSLSTTPMLLEVEPASFSEMAERRIGFYERHGLHLNRYPYLQPPLNKGDKTMPLCMMSWPAPLTPAGFIQARECIYKNVYGLKEDEIAGLIEEAQRRVPQ